MAPDRPPVTIAGRIADGSEIDWSQAEGSARDDAERALLAQLRAIAGVASMHRAPLDLGDSAASDAWRWGSLTVLAPIGEGRFGQVFRAWDARLQRQVALKLLHAEIDPSILSPHHAIEEARLLARVRHPNVLTIYGAECVDGRIGIWTELIEGRTLEALLAERGPLPANEVAAIGGDLCHALAAVHEAGLLHRDIKSQNVMRETGGRIVLMDFGTGRDAESSTGPGDLSGTALYLAPELFSGAPPSVSSDLYALAVLLFHLLTGEFPVMGQTFDEIRAAHANGGRRNIGAWQVLPKPIGRAIARGLSGNPAERFASAAAFGAALETISSPPNKQARRWTILSIAAALAIVATIVGGATVRGWFQSLSATTPQPVVATAPADSSVMRIRLPARVMGRPSHDGRFFPYVDTRGDVEILDVTTGRSRRLTEARSGESGRSSAMSPGGESVAFGWSTSDGAFDLRILNADGSWPRVLMRQTAYEPIPLDWSRDGSHLLCWFHQKNGSADLVVVPIDGGTPRVLDTLPVMERLPTSGEPATASLSPDGRFAAYVRPRATSEQPGRALFLAETNGSQPRLLMDAAPADILPMWAPGGSDVLFVRAGTRIGAESSVWRLRVIDGVVDGDPAPVISRIGPAMSAAVADDGTLYSAISFTNSEIYTAAFDSSAPNAIGVPTRIASESLGQHDGPAWSPDGRSIAYFTLQPAEPGTVPLKTLCIQDVQSGKARTLSPALYFLGGYSPRWAADSQSVVIWGQDAGRRWGYFRVDVRTSATSEVVIPPNNNAPAISQFSPDGRAFLYNDPPRGIVSRDLATGHEDIVVSRNARSSIGRFAIAPDGHAIAFIGISGAESHPTLSLEVQSLDGTTRTLVTVQAPQSIKLQTWTSDSRDVLYTFVATSAPPFSLWRAPAYGSDPQDLHFSVSGGFVNQMSMSPDGRTLAYIDQDVGWELWRRPHALPAASDR